MKYLLFISFNNGLLHNAIYNTLKEVSESIAQLIEDEGLNRNEEKIPTTNHLKRRLQKKDDYFTVLANGTWYHVQTHPVFGI